MAEDATRRTHLANERTLLAWWRTGFACIALGLAVGKIAPEVLDTTVWPWLVDGFAFALYGLALVAFGSHRARAVERAVLRGDYARLSGASLTALTAIGLALGALTIVLMAVST